MIFPHQATNIGRTQSRWRNPSQNLAGAHNLSSKLTRPNISAKKSSQLYLIDAQPSIQRTVTTAAAAAAAPGYSAANSAACPRGGRACKLGRPVAAACPELGKLMRRPCRRMVFLSVSNNRFALFPPRPLLVDAETALCLGGGVCAFVVVDTKLWCFMAVGW